MNTKDLELYISTQEEISAQLLELYDCVFGPLRSTILQILEIKSYYYRAQHQTSATREQLNTFEDYVDSDFPDKLFSQTDVEILCYNMAMPFSKNYTNVRKKHQGFTNRHTCMLDNITPANIDQNLIEQHRFLIQTIPLLSGPFTSILRIISELSTFQQLTPRLTSKHIQGASKTHLLQHRLQSSPQYQNLATITKNTHSKPCKLDPKLIDTIKVQHEMATMELFTCLTSLEEFNYQKSEETHSPYQLNQQIEDTYQNITLCIARVTETFSRLTTQIEDHIDIDLESMFFPNPSVISINLDNCATNDTIGLKLLKMIRHPECTLLSIDLGNNAKVSTSIQLEIQSASLEKRRALGESLFYFAGICMAHGVVFDAARQIMKIIAPRTDETYFRNTLWGNALKCNWLSNKSSEITAQADDSTQARDSDTGQLPLLKFI